MDLSPKDFSKEATVDDVIDLKESIEGSVKNVSNETRNACNSLVTTVSKQVNSDDSNFLSRMDGDVILEDSTRQALVQVKLLFNKDVGIKFPGNY